MTTLQLAEPPDAVVSNLVLEHIPVAVLPMLLRRSFDLLRPGGVMSHAIDLCDHGHYIDQSLSQFNYLRFSPRAWKLIGNDVQHENRLRASQHLEMFRRAGVPVDQVSSRAGEWAQLAAVPVAEGFRHLEVDDLLVIFLHVTSVGARRDRLRRGRQPATRWLLWRERRIAVGADPQGGRT